LKGKEVIHSYVHSTSHTKSPGWCKCKTPFLQINMKVSKKNKKLPKKKRMKKKRRRGRGIKRVFHMAVVKKKMFLKYKKEEI